MVKLGPCNGTRYNIQGKEANPLASNAMDEKGDSNPFGQSL